MEIEKGKRYLCTKTVVMDDDEVDYIKGKVYLSEADGCITDEQGFKRHQWTDGTSPEEYFELFMDERIPVSLTEGQWMVVEKMLSSRVAKLFCEYNDIKDNKSSYMLQGCSESQYETFVMLSKLEWEDMSNLLTKITEQHTGYIEHMHHHGKG